jgi:hypothetical protein
LLSKFLWNPVKGADSSNMLRRLKLQYYDFLFKITINI